LRESCELSPKRKKITGSTQRKKFFRPVEPLAAARSWSGVGQKEKLRRGKKKLAGGIGENSKKR